MHMTDGGLNGDGSRGVGEKQLECGYADGANLRVLRLKTAPAGFPGRLMCDVRKTKASRITPWLWPEDLASQSCHFL